LSEEVKQEEETLEAGGQEQETEHEQKDEPEE
jgi:hypothetical protein